MGDLAAEIKLLAREHKIIPGLSRSGLVCPECMGGSNEDKSLSITHTHHGELLFYCHRASCHAGGTVPEWGDTVVLKKKKNKEPRPFAKETAELSDDQMAWFYTVYGLEPNELTWAQFAYCTETSQVVQPVFSPSRERRGVQLRDYNDKSRIRTYKETVEEPWLCWYGTSAKTGQIIVIVEDQLSALKLSRFYTVACLMGTHFDREKAHEIAKEAETLKSPRVIILLDADAYGLAIRYQRDHSSIIGNLVCEKCSEKDPKYWDNSDLKILGGS